jgi:uncharacterized protein (TIGR02453 family)
MQRIISFLKQIKQNNNREWFGAHKAEYVAANAEFMAFVEQLIMGISLFDKSVKGLTVKDCTYRFYRDVRFSHNKEPYKTHFGAYICPLGKKSGFSGYYFHVEPDGNGFLGGSQLDTGLYGPETKILNSIREEISLNGDVFEATLCNDKGFVLADRNPLKRVPRDYSVDSPYAEYLKLRNPILCKTVDEAFILDRNLLENTLDAFRATLDFNVWLNKAVTYAMEEK